MFNEVNITVCIHAPSVAPLHPWVWPTCSWQGIHADFAGTILNRKFHMVVDAHNKWPGVIPMPLTTAVQNMLKPRDSYLGHIWNSRPVS